MTLLTHIKKGFTLIELLVVIAIIGIVMAIAGANLITAQKQARDAARAQTLKDIESTFEQYYTETGAYPNATSGDIDSAFETGTRPVDPKNSGVSVIDWSYTDDEAYCICAPLETKVGNATAPNSTTCDWDTSAGTHFCVQNRQ